MTSWASFNRHSNLPNGLSVLRGLIGFSLPLFLISNSQVLYIISSFLFTFGAITDYLDGWIARRRGLESNFGKILDPTSDKILILLPLATFSHLGFFSPWWLVPIFIREFVITFCRIGWLVEGKAAGAEKLGKIKLVFQVAMVAVAFAEFLTHRFEILNRWQELTHPITIVSLFIVNALTVVSGWTFLHSNRQLFKSQEFAKFVSACGVGLLPGMTGTWGSLFALVIIPFLYWNPFLYWGAFAFIFWIGFRSVSALNLSQDKDPKYVVIDEVLGMWITFIGMKLSIPVLIVGFFLFRLFDVVKPFPCRRLEKLPGFWGITLDDLGAGIYSCLILHFLFPT